MYQWGYIHQWGYMYQWVAQSYALPPTAEQQPAHSSQREQRSLHRSATATLPRLLCCVARSIKQRRHQQLSFRLINTATPAWWAATGAATTGSAPPCRVLTDDRIKRFIRVDPLQPKRGQNFNGG